MFDTDFLRTSAKSMGFDLSNEQVDNLNCYGKLLIEWNKNINLTAIVEPRDVVIKHFVDSLLLLNHVGKAGASLVDVGAGAGFPSLPCKICDESLQVTMLDSLNKRINFLQAVCSALSINAVCVHGRAEEVGHTAEYREQFDVATARAVAHLRELAEYCLPLVKVGGRFVALKGYDVEEELAESQNAIKLLGGKVIKVAKYELPDSSRRAIVVIEKTSHCKSEYPRNKGRMSKNPL